MARWSRSDSDAAPPPRGPTALKQPRRLTRRGLLLLGAGLAFLEACQRSSAGPRGQALPQRIVSLSPNTTETLFALGAGERVVGRSRYCDYPPEARRLPVVGGYVDPSLEAILALLPDLIVGARGPAGPGIVRPFEERGIPTYFPPTESFAQIRTMIIELSRRLGLEPAGLRLVEEIDADERTVAAAVAHADKPRVLLLFGTSPIVVAGPGSFADEMIRLAGGQNAVTEGTAYPSLGLERVLALDPDVVLHAAMMENDAAELERMPGFRDLRAVRRGDLRVLQNDVVLRPGPRIGKGLVILARAIHPQRAIP